MASDMRLIDANLLDNEINKLQVTLESNEDNQWERNKRYLAGLAWARRIAIESPTIDAVPVVYAMWGYRAYRGIRRVTVSGEIVCSNCHAPYFRVEGVRFKYCPHCGAKMYRGGQQSMICYKDVTYCSRKGCPRKRCPRNLLHVDWSYGLPVCMADLWGQWGICPPRPPRMIEMKEDATDDQSQ